MLACGSFRSTFLSTVVWARYYATWTEVRNKYLPPIRPCYAYRPLRRRTAHPRRYPPSTNTNIQKNIMSSNLFTPSPTTRPSLYPSALAKTSSQSAAIKPSLSGAASSCSPDNPSGRTISQLTCLGSLPVACRPRW